MSDYLSIVMAEYSGLGQRELAKTHQVLRNAAALLLRQANRWDCFIQKALIDAHRYYFNNKKVSKKTLRHSNG